MLLGLVIIDILKTVMKKIDVYMMFLVAISLFTVCFVTM